MNTRTNSQVRTGHLSLLWQSMLATASLLAMSGWCSTSQAAETKTTDSCIECHRDPGFLVTNRKLYDYFQRWQESIHQQEGLSCADCHDGDPSKVDKEGAHGGKLDEAAAASTVNFRNIANTCGECHTAIFEGFRKSKHYEHILAKEQQSQGPTCVTCHGSINAAVVHVNTVAQTCTPCHNPDTKNHPEIPQEANDLLYRFLSIQRYYRYLSVRGGSNTVFLKEADGKLHELSETWHTFDLPRIKADTQSLLNSLRLKREELGRRVPEKQTKTGRSK